MPITTLDPKTALVVIDLQRGIVGLPTAQPVAEVVANAAALAKAFRRRGLPVGLVDAMTDLVPDAHRPGVERSFPRLGETGSTSDVLALLGS